MVRRARFSATAAASALSSVTIAVQGFENFGQNAILRMADYLMKGDGRSEALIRKDMGMDLPRVGPWAKGFFQSQFSDMPYIRDQPTGEWNCAVPNSPPAFFSQDTNFQSMFNCPQNRGACLLPVTQLLATHLLKKNSIFCDRREQKIEFFG